MYSDRIAIEKFNKRRINRLLKRIHLDANVGWAYGMAKGLGADVENMEPKEVFEYIKENGEKGKAKTTKAKTTVKRKTATRKTVTGKTTARRKRTTTKTAEKRILGFPLKVSTGESAESAKVFSKSVNGTNPTVKKILDSIFGMQPTLDVWCSEDTNYSVTDNRINVPELTGKEGKEKEKAISSWIHELVHSANHSQNDYDNGKAATFFPILRTNQNSIVEAWHKEKLNDFSNVHSEIKNFVKKANEDIVKRRKEIINKNEKEAEKIKKKIPPKPRHGDPEYAKSLEKYNKAYDKARAELKELDKKTNREIQKVFSDYNEECMIMNMYDALTNGKALDNGDVCYGHGAVGYYEDYPQERRDGKIDDGVLARNEMLSIYAQMLHSNGEALKLFEKHNPLMAKELRNILEDLGNKGEKLKERSERIEKIVKQNEDIKINEKLYWYDPDVIEGYVNRISKFKKKFPEMEKVIKELSVGDGMFADGKFESGRIKIDGMRGLKKNVFSKTSKGSVKNSTDGDRYIGDLFVRAVLESAAKLGCKKGNRSYKKYESYIMAQDIMEKCESNVGTGKRKEVSDVCNNGGNELAIEECITDVLVNGTKACDLSKEVVKEIRKRLK